MTTDTTMTTDGPSRARPDESCVSLLVISADSLATFPLPADGAVLIGRGSECDVSLVDRQASRRHARLLIGDTFQLEDLGSRNGTFVRESAIAAAVPVPLSLGESVRIGETVLVLQRATRSLGLQRMWTHPYFENRLRDACTRAEPGDTSFALVRMHLTRSVGWMSVVPLLARDLPDNHSFAAYGPNEFELLLTGGPDEVAALVDTVRRSLEDAGIPIQVGTAWYPRDGRSADALFDRANADLRPDSAPPPMLPATLSPAMMGVYQQALKAAKSNINVLLLGEMGVGKEVVARLIHDQSARSKRLYQALNCAGLPETLIESELFGHVRGAFTGATHERKGLLEQANGGTVLLDEIGDMPISIQGRLLRAIENREVRPVGSSQSRPIDVRFIASTNRPIEGAAAAATFRQDLLFRLNTITIRIPPLRERREEILSLARVFLDAAAAETKGTPPTISTAAASALGRYAWPGNVRQLKNVMVRALALCEGDAILLEHLPDELQGDGTAAHETRAPRPVPPPSGHASSHASTHAPSPDDSPEKRQMVEALEKCLWNQSKAATLIGMPRRTFIAKMARYGIPRHRDVVTDPQSD